MCLIMKKRGQLQISFGMIFSIILIVAFIAVAIYAIIVFINMKKCSEIGLFKQDLQEEINRAWNSEESSLTFKGNLPSGIQQVCLIDLSKAGKGSNKELYDSLKKYGYVNVNMFFYPIKKVCKDLRAFNIEHINITEITKQNNPYCVNIVDGKVEVKIEKSFYAALVCLGNSCMESSRSSFSNKNTTNTTGNNYLVGPGDFCGTSTLHSCNLSSDCVAGGCSGQVCEGKNEGIATTCEWKDCYKDEDYGVVCKCVSGKCKWA